MTMGYNAGKCAVVVTHGGFLRVLCRLVLQREPKQAFANCGFAEVLCDGKVLAFKHADGLNAADSGQHAKTSFGGGSFG